MALSTLNLSAACLHIGCAVGFSIYFPIINQTHPNDPTSGIEMSIRDHVLCLKRKGDTVTSSWLSVTLQNPDIKLVQGLVILFFTITGIFHLIYYFNSSLYNNMIHRQNNYLRWIEYSITSTLMLYIIALISGVKDTKIYQVLWAMNIAMIAQGQLIETAVQKGESWWIPMTTGFVLLIVEWSVIVREYMDRVDQVNSFIEANPTQTTKKVPVWITSMIFVMFFFYASFGFISLYGAYKGNEQYETIERLYILFSVIAKATLGLFIAVGITQRQTGSVGGQIQ